MYYISQFVNLNLSITLFINNQMIQFVWKFIFKNIMEITLSVEINIVYIQIVSQ